MFLCVSSIRKVCRSLLGAENVAGDSEKRVLVFRVAGLVRGRRVGGLEVGPLGK